MQSSLGARPRWPPSPSVEDEHESLAHELSGLSFLSEKSAEKGVRFKGTVDQYPIILTMDVPSSPSSTADSSASTMTTGSSASDNSRGPSTPPPASEDEQPFVHAGHSQSIQSPARESPSLPKNVPSLQKGNDSNRPRRQAVSQIPSQAIQDLPGISSGRSRASSYSSSNIEGSKQNIDSVSRSNLLPPEITVLKPRVDVQELERQASAQSLEIIDDQEQRRHDRRYASRGCLDARRVEYEHSLKRACNSQSPNASSSDESRQGSGLRHGYSSDTSTNRRTLQGLPGKPLLEDDKCPGSRRRATTVSERVDGKLGRRKDKQFARPCSLSAAQSYLVRGKSCGVSSAPQSPTRGSRYDSKSQTCRSYSPSNLSSKCEGSVPRTSLSNMTRTPSCRRTVTCPKEEAQKHTSSQPCSRRSSPSREVMRRASPDPSSLSLLPCPRSVPTAGHKDWYTIIEMTHIDICPSCMKQVGHSRFRDYFIPSPPKPRGQKVRCALSEPWTRLAWLQTIKQRHTDLEMLYQITRPASGSVPCPGRTSSVQAWYKVTDPETGMGLPRFNACSACIRNVRILMPSLRNAFKCNPVMQERVCDLATDSPRFVQYLDLLDAAANRYEYERLPSPDMREFVNYARRKTMLRHCRRDRYILSTWHYIPELPEFTICEDCYDDVVYPLAKSGKSIAKMVSPVMRLLPGYGPDQCREASCQLYSPRMRAKFREAVLQHDYKYLKLVALKRFEAENRFRERKQVLLEDERRGYCREAELRKNAEEWKRWE